MVMLQWMPLLSLFLLLLLQLLHLLALLAHVYLQVGGSWNL